MSYRTDDLRRQAESMFPRGTCACGRPVWRHFDPRFDNTSLELVEVFAEVPPRIIMSELQLYGMFLYA
jgi:hypothetical protein